MGTYSTTGDLLLGDIPVPSDAQRYVQDATDEIDSKLGLRYATPILVDDSPENRPTMLLLKRINNWLASGRLLLAKAVSDEGQYNNAYGLKLVTDAEAALESLVTGDMVLPGATPINDSEDQLTGPRINNIDPQSNVESFYSWVNGDPFAPQTSAALYPAGSSVWGYRG